MNFGTRVPLESINRSGGTPSGLKSNSAGFRGKVLGKGLGAGPALVQSEVGFNNGVGTGRFRTRFWRKLLEDSVQTELKFNVVPGKKSLEQVSKNLGALLLL